MRVRMIYPKARTVHAERVMVWAEDAFDNGETDHRPVDVWDAMRILEDVGHCTFDWKWTELHQ